MALNSKSLNDRQYRFYKANTFSNINTATTVSAYPSVLHRIFVQTSSSGTVSVYNSSATSTAIPILSVSAAAKDNFMLDVGASNGLYVVPTSCSVVVVYKSNESV